MLIHHAKPTDRIVGRSQNLHEYPRDAAYQCPVCRVTTDFPKPINLLDSYVDEDSRQLFDLETAANRIRHTNAVDFRCKGCGLQIRILFDHFEDGKSLDSWTVVEILERISETK